MVKYKPELKAQIVREYLSTAQNTNDLSEKYHIGKSQISRWIQRYRLNGPDALKQRRHKRNFTADFKLNVINYYQTHEDSMAEVAARFDILPSQVSIWRSIFEREGITALNPQPKGRPPKVNHPKKQRYKIGDLLKAIRLPKATYHDERKRIANPHDKYAKAKKMILQIAQRFKVRGRWTAGYRRIQAELDKMELHLSGDTIRKLMGELNIQVSLYNRHRNGKYSSYHGTVGKIAANKLNQEFNEHQPYQVIHTDVTQVRLANHQWAYISVMIDEVSQEILAFQLSTSPNKELIMRTL